MLSQLEKAYLSGLGLLTSSSALTLTRIQLTGELNALQYYVTNKDAPTVNPIRWDSSVGSKLNLDTSYVLSLRDALANSSSIISTLMANAVQKQNYGTAPAAPQYVAGSKNGAPVRLEITPRCDIVDNVMSNWSFPAEYDNAMYIWFPESSKQLNMYVTDSSYKFTSENIANMRAFNTDTIEGVMAYYLRLINEFENLDTNVGWVAVNSSDVKIRKYANRRRVWFGGRRSGNYFVAYLKGEGRDILLQCRKGYYAVGYKDVSDSPVTHITGDQSIERMFPLNNIGGLLNKIEGEYKVSEQSFFEYTGEGSIEVFDATLTVSKAWGHITQEFVENYWSTGLGVYTPVSEEIVAQRMKTWNLAAPNGVFFAISNEVCSGRSLTELPFYKEYVKARRKACKDNNFMTLSYNDEYSMRNVEDMLGKLTTRNVWCSDDVATTSTTSTFSMGTVTISDNGDGRFKVVNGTNSAYFAKTESGVSQFFDAYPRYTIVDPTLIIESIVGQDVDGSGVSVLNKQLEPMKTSSFDMSKSSIVRSYAQSYVDLLNNGTTTTGQLAFLCSQLTTYKSMPSMINSLLREFDFDNLAKALVANKLITISKE